MSTVRDFPAPPVGAPDGAPWAKYFSELSTRQNIDLMQELTSPAVGDEVALFDVSETGRVKTKKATVTNLATAIATALNVTSGTYTPTLTAGANVAGSTAYLCNYTRIGSIVRVEGRADVDPTLDATVTVLGISLPVASNFADTEDANGVITSPAEAGVVRGNVANDRAEAQWNSVGTANREMRFVFSYQVI